MNPIEEFVWANICRTCFVMECFETRRCFIAIAFQLCLSVCFTRVQVNQDSLKLNGAHQDPVLADGVYILEESASGFCRFNIGLQQNAIACGIYGMRGFTLSTNCMYLQSFLYYTVL